MIDLRFDPELAGIALAVAAGAGLGWTYFGALRWTVERLARARRPARLFLASYLARLAAAGAGFVLVADGSAARALACLAGFVVARAAVSRRLERGPRTEAGDAPQP